MSAGLSFIFWYIFISLENATCHSLYTCPVTDLSFNVRVASDLQVLSRKSRHCPSPLYCMLWSLQFMKAALLSRSSMDFTVHGTHVLQFLAVQQITQFESKYLSGSLLTSIVLQEDNSGIDDCGRGIGRWWLVDWREGGWVVSASARLGHFI